MRELGHNAWNVMALTQSALQRGYPKRPLGLRKEHQARQRTRSPDDLQGQEGHEVLQWRLQTRLRHHQRHGQRRR